MARALSFLRELVPPFSQAAEHLFGFAVTGELSELRAVKRSDAEVLAHAIAHRFSLREVAVMLEASTLQIPRAVTLAQPDTASALLRALDLFGELPSAGPPPAFLVVTDRCDDEGRVTGSLHAITGGSTRVYAVFENQGELRGREHVVAVWRDLKRDRIALAATEPIRPETGYNYVWLQIDAGWPPGAYEVELRDPAVGGHLLGRSRFLVK